MLRYFNHYGRINALMSESMISEFRALSFSIQRLILLSVPTKLSYTIQVVEFKLIHGTSASKMSNEEFITMCGIHVPKLNNMANLVKQ